MISYLYLGICLFSEPRRWPNSFGVCLLTFTKYTTHKQIAEVIGDSAKRFFFVVKLDKVHRVHYSTCLYTLNKGRVN